jgi:hypothetical protein
MAIPRLFHSNVYGEIVMTCIDTANNNSGSKSHEALSRQLQPLLPSSYDTLLKIL